MSPKELLIRKEFREYIEAFKIFRQMVHDKGLCGNMTFKLSSEDVVNLWDRWYQSRGISLYMDEPKVENKEEPVKTYPW